MQFLYIGKKLAFGNSSLLLFKDDFSKFSLDENGIARYERGVWSRYTVGGNLFGTLKRVSFAASAFYQGGRYREGTSLNEYLLSASALYAANPRFSFGPGVDITSGNNGSDPSKRFQRFDPLYGTPHKFWGYMDYFYVADGFGASGLVNYYLKSRFKARENFLITADVHRFALPESMPAEGGEKLSKTLGTEVDIVLNYALTKVVQVEGGFSAMFSTETMLSAGVKNNQRAKDVSTWAYLMITIKPDFLSNNNTKRTLL